MIETAGYDTQVTRIFSRHVNVDILAVGDDPLPLSFKGQIRIQDLSQKNPDQVVIAQCVRPGDIIRGKVLYRSDAYGFCLSTKEDPFGVVHAESFLGHPMTIVDKSTMSCPITKVQEARKVATRKLVSNDKAWNERA